MVNYTCSDIKIYDPIKVISNHKMDQGLLRTKNCLVQEICTNEFKFRKNISYHLQERVKCQFTNPFHMLERLVHLTNIWKYSWEIHQFRQRENMIRSFLDNELYRSVKCYMRGDLVWWFFIVSYCPMDSVHMILKHYSFYHSKVLENPAGHEIWKKPPLVSHRQSCFVVKLDAKMT